MNSFASRASSAFFFVLIMIAGITQHRFSFFLIHLIIAAGCLYEFYKVSESRRADDSRFGSRYLPIGITAGLLLYSLSFLSGKAMPGADLLVFFPAVLFALFALELFGHSANPFQQAAWNILAQVYVTLPLMLANRIEREEGPWVLMGIIAIIWLNDSMAYAAGSLFGKRPFFQRLSPKKTLEGFLGGTLLTMLLCMLLPQIVPALSMSQWMLMAMVVAPAGTMGDLMESALKRSAGVKDSGFLMPGHGGFLDRFDAYLFALPFAALLLWMFRNKALIALWQEIL